MWGIRVVIPVKLRRQIMDSSPGITRMKSLARDYGEQVCQRFRDICEK